MSDLDVNSPERVHLIKRNLRSKWSLHQIYTEQYNRYLDCIKRCPNEGIVVEIGTGGGFSKEIIPEIHTSDIINYPNLDLVIDCCHMPFETETVKCFLMTNVFHHLPDVEAFLIEASRCLKKNGRILIIDQHVGYISSPILKYFHNECFDLNTTQWQFESTGPLSGANGALAWIVFYRDREKFREKFGEKLSLLAYTPNTPVAYWLTGGQKKWCLLPRFFYGTIKKIEKMLLKISPNFGSFVDIELIKK